MPGTLGYATATGFCVYGGGSFGRCGGSRRVQLYAEAQGGKGRPLADWRGGGQLNGGQWGEVRSTAGRSTVAGGMSNTFDTIVDFSFSFFINTHQRAQVDDI